MWEWILVVGGNNYLKLGECRIMEGIMVVELYGKVIVWNDNWLLLIFLCKIRFVFIVWIKN